MNTISNFNKIALFALVAVPALSAAGPVPHAPKSPVAFAQKMMSHTTGAFSGPEVQGGTATLSTKMGKSVIMVSDDFKIPASPAPHYRIQDSKGNLYLLDRLTLVGGKTKRSVVLPSYIKDVKKVQIWCSFAEVILGEASFSSAVKAR